MYVLEYFIRRQNNIVIKFLVNILNKIYYSVILVYCVYLDSIIKLCFLWLSCSLREIYFFCKFIDLFGNEVILQCGWNVFFISNCLIMNIKCNFGCFNEQMDMIGL